MKIKSITKYILLLTTLCLLLASCSASAEKWNAVVLSTYEADEGGSISIYTDFVITNTEARNDLATLSITKDTKLKDENGKAITLADIKPGQLIEVAAENLVQEIYPRNYPRVYSVKVLGYADEALYNEALQKERDFNSQFDD